MLTMRLESGENVFVSMFDSMALAFHTKFDSYGREPKVLIVTGVNPKIVGGMRFSVSSFWLLSSICFSNAYQSF